MFSPETVDRVLLQVGKFGRFQFINCLVVNMPIMFSALYTIAYVFTAQDLNYRCLIPECDTGYPAYQPPWLPAAVPYSNGHPDSCSRFGLRRSNHTATPATTTSSTSTASCPANLFDEARTEQCHKWVFEPGQRSTLVNEWEITCEENKWKLTLVGTIGYIGAFVGMPLAGYLSDRFGRKTLLLWSWILASLSGLIQSFSTNFPMFLVFEFGDSFFEAGVYGAGFLLALELVGPQQRVMPTTLLSLFYSSGNALLGALAWAVQDWRWLLRAVYGGGLLFAVPLWFTPESVRWLVTRGRVEEADAIVARVAAVNKVPINETFAAIAAAQSSDLPETSKGKEDDGGTLRSLLRLFKSKILLMRFINCAYCWMANTFVYYGLSLNAVTLSGDQYVNFILSGLVEIPANLLAFWLQDRAGRRFSQSGALIVAGVSCLSFLAIPEDMQWLQVTVYMLGKFAITISFTVVYIITAEMFPTNVRQSLVSYGSTFGRVGSMLAPQTPLLATVSEALPLALFGIVSLSSGLLALFFPETTGRPLPETIEEAESLDSKSCFGSSKCEPTICKK